METGKTLMGMAVLLLMMSCSTDRDTSDAYGQFEATEIRVSSQARGELVFFEVNEGEQLKKNQVVGAVDSSDLMHRRNELRARKKAAHAKLASVDAEKEVLKTELKNARKDLRRTSALYKEEAATEKQLEDLRSRVAVLERKIDAVEVQKGSVEADIAALEAKIGRVNQQVRNVRVKNPATGTVLTTLAEQGEVVRYGQPLYKIADLSTMKLRVYVSGAQLPQIELGQQVQVRIDKDKSDYQNMKGTVSWIASKAEFTPQMIQTKEERVNQVYAVEIRVENDGSLKIGMPGEVKF